MSSNMAPPFSVVTKISEKLIADADKASLKRLRSTVAGRDATFPRSVAMDLLLGTDFPNKHRDFESVLENETEAPEIRYLAAINLGKIDTPAAIKILVKNSRARDELVLAGVMKALRFIGNKSALEVVLTAKKHARGLAAVEAEFSEIVISHRLGGTEREPSVPKTGNHLEIDLNCARPFRITRADDIDAELCLRSLASQPLGIELSEHPMYQIRCGRNTSMIVLNRDLSDSGSVMILRRRKAFLGVIAIRSEETQLYSVGFLMLTSPAGDEDAVSILIYRTNGKLAFSGTGRVRADCAQFSILAISRPGAFGVKIEGTFEDGRLDMKTTLATTFVQIRKREPIEEKALNVKLEDESEMR